MKRHIRAELMKGARKGELDYYEDEYTRRKYFLRYWDLVNKDNNKRGYERKESESRKKSEYSINQDRVMHKARTVLSQYVQSDMKFKKQILLILDNRKITSAFNFCELRAISLPRATTFWIVFYNAGSYIMQCSSSIPNHNG